MSNITIRSHTVTYPKRLLSNKTFSCCTDSRVRQHQFMSQLNMLNDHDPKFDF